MQNLPANRMRVLIVEDDQVTAKTLEITLRRRGFLVVGTATSAGEAIKLAEVEKPQIALLDIKLETVGAGIELAETLRKSHQIPVVFVTGFSEEALFEQARAAKPVGFLRKPFSEAELIVCLESVLERGIAVEGLAERLPGIKVVSDPLPDGVVVSDLDGKVRHLNRAAEQLTGWRREDCEDSPLADVVPIREVENDPAGDNAGDEGGPGLSSRRVVLTRRDGSTIPVEERTAPIRTGDGEMVGLLTILASTPSSTENADSGMEEASSLADSGEADDPDEEDGIGGFVPPARADALKKIAALSRDPGFRRLLRNPSPAEDGAGESGGVPASVPVESQLSHPEPAGSAARETTPLIDEVGDPLLRISEEGTITYANAEAVSVFGKGHSLVGLSFWDRFSNEEFERYGESLQKPLRDGLRHRFDFHDSSRGCWFEVRVYRTDSGVLALFTDITKRKLDSAESLRNQRLEGLGLLARGFAHDFNNFLTTITGNISLARERQPDDAETQQMLSEAQTAASRATGLVQQLMTFAQGGRPIRKRTRISDLIRRILTEQRLQHPEIRYQFQGSDSELVANVDPAQISRLVENLVANSALAMSDGGVLIVKCGIISPEEVRQLKDSHDPTGEDHLLIEVIDTGHGMSEESLGRVFEPYFTTRDEDNATGIGLTVCESIAKAHGGFVQLQSKEGKGTIASFCAPLGHHPDTNAAGFTTNEEEILSPPPLQTGAQITPPPIQVNDAEGGLLVGTRILILEDDAPIRRLMAATLRRAGHEVVETKDGRETIAIYRDAMENGSRFHLLICDLTIENGVGGVETMRQLTQIDPSILAIVSSGYSDAPAMSSPASFGFSGVLPKPYAPSELRAAVHRILTAHHIIS